ncbi:hypothetical protein [Bacillus altitudinis]|uniref:hypothetical protein n=1 Tax=Bacillus altitudinis TaxID=293387 RepID=UPI0011A861CE|nr:hypothetical protein [Bacillus altitudinis]
MLFFGYNRDDLNVLRCEIVKLVLGKVQFVVWGEYYGVEISLCVDDMDVGVDDDGGEKEESVVHE